MLAGFEVIGRAWVGKLRARHTGAVNMRGDQRNNSFSLRNEEGELQRIPQA
jgi:hypothetical protein